MMWGDRSPRVKLTGDSRRGFEAVLIGDCRSFRSLARNGPLRVLRLLQQYLPKADSLEPRDGCPLRAHLAGILLPAITPLTVLDHQATGVRELKNSTSR